MWILTKELLAFMNTIIKALSRSSTVIIAIVFIFIQFVSSSSLAGTQANTCTDCSSDGTPKNISAITDVLKYKHGLPRIGRVYNQRCENFISRRGERGMWGDELLLAIDRVAPKCMYEKMNVSSVCPKFKNFNQQMKENFWLYAFASIAQKESSCDPTVRVPGLPGRLADGLLQLEYEREWRAKAERNPRWCKTNVAQDTQDITFQMECAVSIFNDTICAKNRSITNGNGYWQKLRYNRSISKMIKGFPACK